MNGHASGNPRKPRGRPFQSGNPGRPLGSKNKSAVMLRSLVSNEGEQIIRTLIRKALDGDSAALRLVVEILMGSKQERLLPGIDLPIIKSAADGPRAMAAIVKAIADGLISPSEGEALVNIVDRTIRAFAIRDEDTRLDAIEAELLPKKE